MTDEIEAKARAAVDAIGWPLSSKAFRHGIAAALREQAEAHRVSDARWQSNYQNAWAALRMIREAVEEFGPSASLEGPDAVLLRGPEPTHEAQAIVDALTRLSRKFDDRQDHIHRLNDRIDAMEAQAEAHKAELSDWRKQYAEIVEKFAEQEDQIDALEARDARLVALLRRTWDSIDDEDLLSDIEDEIGHPHDAEIAKGGTT